MSLVSDVLPVLDAVGGLLDDLGFNDYDVAVRVVEWSGERVGDGTSTVTTTALTLDGVHRLEIERVSGHDISVLGLKEGDYKVGPFTPPFAGGGRAPSYFAPDIDANVPTEVLYRLTGPGLESGAWFKRVDQILTDPFEYFIVLRAVNVTDPE